MNVAQVISMLQCAPSEYKVVVREGNDKHIGTPWGTLIQGNYTIDHERKEIRIWAEPV